MIDPGTSWRWNQSPAKCGVVKNNSCSALIFTISLCARSRRGEGRKLLHFCCPSQTRNCENQAATGFLQSRSSGITFLSGTTPRKGFRLGFARKTKLTPVTFPHDCMHRRTLSPVSSLCWNSRRMGDLAVSFLHVLVLFLISAAGVCFPCVPPDPQPVLSRCFCPSWRLSLVSVPSPVYVVLKDCRNQPFPRSSAAEIANFPL